jgi:hypothetical protein
LVPIGTMEASTSRARIFNSELINVIQLILFRYHRRSCLRNQWRVSMLEKDVGLE